MENFINAESGCEWSVKLLIFVKDFGHTLLVTDDASIAHGTIKINQTRHY